MNEPAATSYWQRIATRVREAIGGVRDSGAATAAIQEYSRVIPVLAGQVREAASSIEQTREALQHARDRRIHNARCSMAAAVSMEDAISALRVISLRLSGTHDVDAIRQLVADLEERLTPAMNVLRHSAESGLEAAQENALLAEDRAGQRLQNVVETLSEMQDEFVAALERPQKPTEPSGSAALRLRQRYIATAATPQ